MKTHCIREWRPVSTATPFIFWISRFFFELVLGDLCAAKGSPNL
jgi:hypothetical protein